MDNTLTADRSANDISFGRYISHTINFMQFLRMWETDVSLPRWRNLAITTMVAVLCTGNFILMLSEIMDIRNSLDLQDGAANVGATWLHFTGLLKWTYFMLNSKKLVKLIKSLEYCHYLCLQINKHDRGREKFREIMNKARKQSVMFMNGWTAVCVLGIADWCVNPFILNWHKKNYDTVMADDTQAVILPYHGWFPWDLNDSSGYAYAYVIQCIGALGAVLGTASYDVFYLTILMILCAQFLYVDHSLSDHTSDESRGRLRESAHRWKRIIFPHRYHHLEMKFMALQRDKIDNIYLEEKLKNCIIHHQAVLNCLRMLEELASPAMFVQCINTIGVICLISFAALTNLSADIQNIIKLLSLAIYFFGGCFQLFFFCFIASQITYMGLQVAVTAYSSGWEVMLEERTAITFELHSRKVRNIRVLLQLLMIRAQKPIHMTGGPFYVLSLETFTSIVGLAFSYFTVLKQINEE